MSAVAGSWGQGFCFDGQNDCMVSQTKLSFELWTAHFLGGEICVKCDMNLLKKD